MKILAIRGKNLASLENEFEIDFTVSPLLSAGIFAITGNTGSGKSTILDALCLALFDDTPRTNKATENVQIKDVQERTISQKDSRNILRRGTAEGYAEVDFRALDGNIFRSRWMVRRARNQSEGSLQQTEIKLENLSSSISEQGTKTDLLKRITELIGMNFSQFTRSVLLAQGDFATFLKGKQSEKAELLEKLTGTEIYAHISEAIYEKRKTAEADWKILHQQIGNFRLLNEEETHLLLTEKKEKEKEKNEVETRLNFIEKKIEWLIKEESIQKEIQENESEWKNWKQYF